jgi:hypothetical protein
MSLFNVREWWSTRCGDGDDVCAPGCLTTGRLLPDPRGTDAHVCALPSSIITDQLIVGTHSGQLLVYDPSQSVAVDASFNDSTYKPEHLLIDLKLQVSSARTCMHVCRCTAAGDSSAV